MALSKAKSSRSRGDSRGSGAKFLFLVTALLVSGIYCWANFYVFYSDRLPGRITVKLKPAPDWQYCLINLDEIFPRTQDEMQSLLLGVETLEKKPALRQIIEDNKLLSRLFSTPQAPAFGI